MPDSAASTTSPSTALLGHLVTELRQHAPFAQMSLAHVRAFVGVARETYYAPGEVVMQPADGAVQRLVFIRRGGVSGRPARDEPPFQLEPGEFFPVGAWLGVRAVTSTYEATEDCFCLEVGAQAARDLARDCAAFADFLNRRVHHLLELSRRALHRAQAEQALSEQSMTATLGSLPRKTPLGCAPQTPLTEALRLMHERRVGSVLALDPQGAALGILTRHDVLGRVALGRPPDHATLESVMSRPLRTLDAGATVQDAVLEMSRHGIRHIPITEGGRVVSIVSERDLFALQRQSLKHVSTQIRNAPDRESLVAAASEIRRYAGHLMLQGVAARTLTQMLSHLNDLLTQRLVEITARRHGLALSTAAWLAFGSEGRGEQTIATDQDNGLVFTSADPERDRPAWLAMADEVNVALDACGYPLCKGNVMARNPQCCLTADEWIARFGHWMEHGAPEDLLAASIYFDFRPIAGDAGLVEPMREFVTRRAAQLPRFMKQLADNAQRMRVPLNWRGALEPTVADGHRWIDLKLQGTAILVDAARLYALAHGIAETSTHARLEAIARPLGARASEAADWVRSFELLQQLRLHLQAGPDADASQPNRIDIDTLSSIDRRLLKEALRITQSLQQRLALDYPG